MDRPAETDDPRPCVRVTATSGRRAVLLTSDGVPIEAEHLPAANGSGRLAIVVAHGFTGALERPAVRRAARRFSAYGGVVTFSFRGHGRSGGRSTVGDLEVLDLAAAVAWAHRLGYRRVATVGFSMAARWCCGTPRGRTTWPPWPRSAHRPAGTTAGPRRCAGCTGW